MRKSIWAMVVLAGLMGGFTAAFAADWTSTVKDVEKSVVFVQVGHEGSCTGFVINQVKHYVLTAGHCEPDEDTATVWVDHVRGTIIALDHDKDLMVLEAKDLDPARPALGLAGRNPERGQELMSVGYGLGLSTPMYRTAHVEDDATMIPEDGVGGPYIAVDAGYVPGQSGGPVVDRTGRVVSIVQRGTGNVGIGVGADAIRASVGRFFEAQPQKGTK